MKNNTKIFNFLKIFLFFIISIYIIANTLSLFICYYTASKLPDVGAQEFLRIKIYGSTYSSTGNTISASFSLVDSNGYDLAVIERSWSGSYLAVQFSDVKIKEKHYTFPSRIYGKNKIIEEKSEQKKGTNLVKYYNINNQCRLFGYGYTTEDRKNFYRLSSFVTKKYPLLYFGQVNNFSVDLSNCRPDRYYSIGTNGKGEIIVTEI